MGFMNEPIPIFKDTKYVFMTPDLKCVVCGANKWDLHLKLVEEKSRYKVKQVRNASTVLDTIKISVKRNCLKMTDKVKTFYYTEDNYYNEDKFGELIAVKVEADYFLVE